MFININPDLFTYNANKVMYRIQYIHSLFMDKLVEFMQFDKHRISYNIYSFIYKKGQIIKKVSMQTDTSMLPIICRVFSVLKPVPGTKMNFMHF